MLLVSSKSRLLLLRHMWHQHLIFHAEPAGYSGPCCWPSGCWLQQHRPWCHVGCRQHC